MSISSRTSTLNGDIQITVCKDVEAYEEAPQLAGSDSTPTLAGGPTKEFFYLPVPPYLRHSPGEDIHFGLGTVSLLSLCTIFRECHQFNLGINL